MSSNNNQTKSTASMRFEYEQLEADLFKDLMPEPPREISEVLRKMQHCIRVLDTPGITRDSWSVFEDSLLRWCQQYKRLTSQWQKEQSH